MSSNNYFVLICEILYNVCELDPSIKVSDSSRFIDDLALDSMAMLALSAELENRLQKVLEYSFENPPQTVGELILILEQQSTKRTYEDTL